MPNYRLYLLNEHSGHIDGFEEFDSASDEQAISRAAERDHLTPTELWSGGNKVARFDGRPR